MPKFSIIVPVYNVEKYIRRCVDSILSQSFSDFELILVDDGSPDGSGAICDEYAEKDARVRVIHKENGGVSTARNVGIDASIGERIMFVDSDDWIVEGAIEKIFDAIEKSDNDVLSFSFSSYYDNSLTPYDVEDLKMDMEKFVNRMPEIKGINSILSTIVTKVYKKAILDKYHIRFNEKIEYGEDFIFNVSYYFYAKNISSISQRFYIYDISVENSAVKKFYYEFNEYVIQMDKALRMLVGRFATDNTEVDNFCKRFINDKWEYAIYICTYSLLPDSEKALWLTDCLKQISRENIELMKHSDCLLLKYWKLYSRYGKIRACDVQKCKKRVGLMKRIYCKLKKIFRK